MNTGDLILIGSFGVPVIIILIVFFMVKRGLNKGAKFVKEISERKLRAIPMNARIINARQGIGGGSIRSIVHFKLEILDPKYPYEAKATWFVESLYFSQAQPGEVISVKVDSENKNIIYPDVPWAIYTEGYGKLGELSKDI